jgi:hypothetical protein
VGGSSCPTTSTCWEAAQNGRDDVATSVIAPLNPADYGIDPLSFI